MAASPKWADFVSGVVGKAALAVCKAPEGAWASGLEVAFSSVRRYIFRIRNTAILPSLFAPGTREAGVVSWRSYFACCITRYAICNVRVFYLFADITPPRTADCARLVRPRFRLIPPTNFLPHVRDKSVLEKDPAPSIRPRALHRRAADWAIVLCTLNRNACHT